MSEIIPQLPPVAPEYTPLELPAINFIPADQPSIAPIFQARQLNMAEEELEFRKQEAVLRAESERLDQEMRRQTLEFQKRKFEDYDLPLLAGELAQMKDEAADREWRRGIEEAAFISKSLNDYQSFMSIRPRGEQDMQTLNNLREKYSPADILSKMSDPNISEDQRSELALELNRKIRQFPLDQDAIKLMQKNAQEDRVLAGLSQMKNISPEGTEYFKSAYSNYLRTGDVSFLDKIEPFAMQQFAIDPNLSRYDAAKWLYDQGTITGEEFQAIVDHRPTSTSSGRTRTSTSGPIRSSGGEEIKPELYYGSTKVYNTEGNFNAGFKESIKGNANSQLNINGINIKQGDLVAPDKKNNSPLNSVDFMPTDVLPNGDVMGKLQIRATKDQVKKFEEKYGVRPIPNTSVEGKKPTGSEKMVYEYEIPNVRVAGAVSYKGGVANVENSVQSPGGYQSSNEKFNPYSDTETHVSKDGRKAYGLGPRATGDVNAGYVESNTEYYNSPEVKTLAATFMDHESRKGDWSSVIAGTTSDPRTGRNIPMAGMETLNSSAIGTKQISWFSHKDSILKVVPKLDQMASRMLNTPEQVSQIDAYWSELIPEKHFINKKVKELPEDQQLVEKARIIAFAVNPEFQSQYFEWKTLTDYIPRAKRLREAYPDLASKYDDYQLTYLIHHEGAAGAEIYLKSGGQELYNNPDRSESQAKADKASLPQIIRAIGENTVRNGLPARLNARLSSSNMVAYREYQVMNIGVQTVVKEIMPSGPTGSREKILSLSEFRDIFSNQFGHSTLAVPAKGKSNVGAGYYQAPTRN